MFLFATFRKVKGAKFYWKLFQICAKKSIPHFPFLGGSAGIEWI